MRDKKIIGYVGTKDLGLLQEKDIRILNVINLAFGHIEDDAVVYDPGENAKYLKRVKEINPDCAIVLSVGGWSAGGFSEAAATEEGRKKVAATSLELIKKYDLDGIDIDWEYPCIGIAGIKASPADKENFTLFLKQLRETLDTFTERKLLLTIAAGGDSYYTRCTNMAEAQKYLDYVQIMSYDLRGGFVVHTGHHTNLYTNPADLSPVSADFAVNCFVEAGVPREKLVIGAAFYSRMWKEVPDVDHGYMQMAGTTGGYGPSYGDLKENYIEKNGFVRYWDDAAKAPWLFDGKTFISYEDEESLKAKAEYVKDQGLLGIMYWEYCLDSSYTLTSCLDEALQE